MSGNISRTIYQLGFQVSPIILTGGIANLFGGYLPIVAIIEGPNAILNTTSGNTPTNLDNFFAHFTPLPGSTLLNYNIGQYPFANQIVAANAIIAEPLSISLKMSTPVNKRGGHSSKLATMIILQALLKQHSEQGGTYIIVTPAAFYLGCILTRLVDISSDENPIPQNTWQFDFVQPLTSTQQAQGAFSTLMNRISNGLFTSGSWNATATASLSPSTVASGITGLNPVLPGSLPPPIPIPGV